MSFFPNSFHPFRARHPEGMPQVFPPVRNVWCINEKSLSENLVARSMFQAVLRRGSLPTEHRHKNCMHDKDRGKNFEHIFLRLTRRKLARYLPTADFISRRSVLFEEAFKFYYGKYTYLACINKCNFEHYFLEICTEKWVEILCECYECIQEFFV